MFDKHETAILRGFDTVVADIGDQLRLCHPLLSFEGDPTLYVARRFNWQNDQAALASADPSEASELAMLLPDEHRWPIASGEAIVAAGAGFVQAAAAAGIQLDGSEISFATHESGCWVGTATQALFAELETRLVDEARTAFDEALGDAAHLGHHLSERGDAALLILRRCGPLRREDLAIRQLAAAKQNRELDLYRRLLVRFELELETPKDDLDKEVKRHIELAASPPWHKKLDPFLARNREPLYSYVGTVYAAKPQFSVIWMKIPNQHVALRSRNVTERQPGIFFNTAIGEDNARSEKFSEIGYLRQGVQQVNRGSPPKTVPKIGLIDDFYSKATVTSSKPKIDLPLYEVATSPVVG